MEISTTAPVFYPNHLRVLSVLGNRIRVQFCFNWDTTDLRADLTIEDILSIEGDFFGKMRGRFGYVPESELLSEFLMSHEEDLDYYLSDDCNVLVGRQIQDGIRNALDQIV